MSPTAELQRVEPNHQSTELAENTRSAKVVIPRADIFERQNDIVVMADMPGVDEGSIDITVEKNVLSIHGSVQPETPTNHSLTYCEYTIADYQRKFVLPNEVDRDGISASLKNGVLKLLLPKSASAQAKKISVKSEP